MYRLFLLPKCRLQLNDRLNGIWFCDDLFFGEWAKQRRLRWGRDRKTTFRQTGGKQQTVCDRKSVAYRSKQGNCIDSFHPNRLHKPITLWRIPQSPQKSKKGLMLWMKPRTKIYLSVWAKKKKYHCAERQKVRAFRIGISPPTCFGIYAENRPARNILHF